ncbi:MAG: hypothetical protein MUO43_16485 [Desulfobacterales bacterium]|nr:hypothetical protein [Desulfobacterales bacterium]
MIANIEGYIMLDELYYHKEHIWIRVDDNIAMVGMIDFSQKLAGELSYIELPSVGDGLEMGRWWDFGNWQMDWENIKDAEK